MLAGFVDLCANSGTAYAGKCAPLNHRWVYNRHINHERCETCGLNYYKEGSAPNTHIILQYCFLCDERRMVECYCDPNPASHIKEVQAFLERFRHPKQPTSMKYVNTGQKAPRIIIRARKTLSIKAQRSLRIEVANDFVKRPPREVSFCKNEYQ